MANTQTIIIGSSSRRRRRATAAAVMCVLAAMSAMSRVRSAEILVVFPTTAQSHYRVVRPLVRGLLDRGHRVLAITNFPDTDRESVDGNLSHIDISSVKPHSEVRAGETGWASLAGRMYGNVDRYAAVLDYPPVARLLQSGRAFDLVIAEFFLTTPIFAPIAAAVRAPIVGVCPMVTFPWLYETMGAGIAPSYAPSVLFQSTSDQSFSRRLRDHVYSVSFHVFSEWILGPKMQHVNRLRHGLHTRHFLESLANVSVILTNNYHSAFVSLPNVPGIVDVGGIHVEDEKPLSREFNDFINSADHGVILFSLGSVVSKSSLAEDKLNNIMETFSKLRQKIIMKYDADNNTISLPNVKMVKWLPQRDLLAHPKVILFISHAGMMSSIETIHCGKPMVAIPVFGDQIFMSQLLIKKQVATTVDFTHLKSDKLLEAINIALTENYRINAKKLQQLYNDRPQSPLETAIYWVEYVIRNKDESKELLKSPKIHLNFYQTYLIDVFAALFLPILITILCILWIIKHLKKY